MKTKLNTIKNRFILFVLLIILSGIIIGFVSINTISSIKRNNNIVNSTNTIKINVNDIKVHLDDFIQKEVNNLVFYKTGKTDALISLKQKHQNNTLLTDDIFTKQNVKVVKELNDKFVSIKEEQSHFSEVLNTLTENYRDRGYESYGLVGNMMNQVNKLKEMINDVVDMSIADQLNYVVTLSTSFNEDLKKGTYNEIVYAIDETVSMIKMNTLEDNMVNYTAVLNQLELMKATAGKIMSINENIGFKENKGLYKELVSTWGELNNLFFEISETIKERIPEANKRLVRLLLLIIAIIIILLTASFFIIVYPVTGSLSKLKSYSRQLLTGELPNKVEMPNKDEINDIAENLDHVIKELRKKTNFTREMAENKLDTSYSPLGDHDELGNSLLDLRSGLQVAAEEDKKHRIENEKRRWTNEGLARFGEILRANNDNTELLCDNIIKNLVTYLNSNQGGIYLYNDEDKNDIHLDMISAFAFDRKKYLEKKISLGEGLVGTCAIEKQTIYMKEIPEDYITITSGLGGSNPRSLLIVPLKLEDDVLGVAEIASFNELESHEIEFVEKIAESIASTLSSAKINERTAQLLEQSQKQAQEMAEQEEEMRQNMEELQATQEESARRESEMYGLLHAINSATYVLELDMDGYITECNERLLFLLELQRDAVIGTHHSDFTSMNKNSPEYINFWKELKEGNTKTKIQKFESFSGQEIWLKQNYTPIFNKEGNALKIVCISTDITENVKHEKNIQKKEREISTYALENENLNNTLNIAFLKAEIDGEGKIISVNPNFENTTGYVQKELIGKKIIDLIAKDEINNFNRLLESVKNGTVFNNLLKFEFANGNQAIVKSLLNPVFNEAKQLEKIIFIGQEYSSQ